MKKRVRKKLGRKGFLKFGFAVRILFNPELDEGGAVIGEFWERLREIVAERQMLVMGLTADRLFIFNDTRMAPHRAATENDRQCITDWLGQQLEVNNYWIGPTTANWKPSETPF